MGRLVETIGGQLVGARGPSGVGRPQSREGPVFWAGKLGA